MRTALLWTLLASLLVLSGCYTTLSHPRIAVDESTGEPLAVAEGSSSSCLECHVGPNHAWDPGADYRHRDYGYDPYVPPAYSDWAWYPSTWGYSYWGDPFWRHYAYHWRDPYYYRYRPYRDDHYGSGGSSGERRPVVRNERTPWQRPSPPGGGRPQQVQTQDRGSSSSGSDANTNQNGKQSDTKPSKKKNDRTPWGRP